MVFWIPLILYNLLVASKKIIKYFRGRFSRKYGVYFQGKSEKYFETVNIYSGPEFFFYLQNFTFNFFFI